MDKQKLDEKNFIRHKMFNDNRSALVKYADLVIGKFSFFKLIKYELIMTFFPPLPGAAGIFLRRLAFPFLFKQIGRKVIWGRNIVIRHPEKIFIGNRVVVDDYCVIDGRGAGDQGVVVGDDVFIGRNVNIQSKVGGISIGSETSIGAGTSIVSQGGIIIGDMVNIAGGCSISGGAYDVTRGQKSEREHEKYTKGPIQIGRKCRLGQQVMVLDGVQIGEGSILGAKALVNGSLPEYCVAAGIPAKVMRLRERKDAEDSYDE